MIFASTSYYITRQETICASILEGKDSCLFRLVISRTYHNEEDYTHTLGT